MATKTAEFLVKMSQDPRLRAKFKKDAKGTMKAFGLTAKDQAVLTSGDPDRIRKHLGDDLPAGFFVMLFGK